MIRKPINIFLTIAISLCILAGSTYCQYYTLAAADFISGALKLENFDQEYLAASNQSELKASGSSSLVKGFHLVTCLLGLSFHLSPQKPSLDQKNLVLRC